MGCGSCLPPLAFGKPVQDIADSAVGGMLEKRRLAVQTDWVAGMLDCAAPDIFHLVVTLSLPFSSLASRF